MKPRVGKSCGSATLHLVLPSKPLAEPMPRVAVNGSVGRADRSQTEVVRPSQKLPVQFRYSVLDRRPQPSSAGQLVDLGLEAVDLLRRRPGRPGWLPTQAPHRSGRAEFQHPVPHLMSSLPARSGAVALTDSRSRCTSPVSLPRVMRRCPLPSPGSLRLVPLAQRYYEALRLPAARLAALRFLRLAIPTWCPRFVPAARDGNCGSARSLVSRNPAGMNVATGRVSQVPVKPS